MFKCFFNFNKNTKLRANLKYPLKIKIIFEKKFQKDLDNNSPRWAKDSTQK